MPKKLNRYREPTTGKWYVTQQKEEKRTPIAIIPAEPLDFYVYSTEDVEPQEPIANAQLIKSAPSVLRGGELAMGMLNNPPDSIRLKKAYISKIEKLVDLAKSYTLSVKYPES